LSFGVVYEKKRNEKTADENKWMHVWIRHTLKQIHISAAHWLSASSLIGKETVPFRGSFIRARPLAKKTASLIKKETLNGED
jgi:hypothetical protein